MAAGATHRADDTTTPATYVCEDVIGAFPDAGARPRVTSLNTVASYAFRSRCPMLERSRPTLRRRTAVEAAVETAPLVIVAGATGIVRAWATARRPDATPVVTLAGTTL